MTTKEHKQIERYVDAIVEHFEKSLDIKAQVYEVPKKDRPVKDDIRISTTRA